MGFLAVVHDITHALFGGQARPRAEEFKSLRGPFLCCFLNNALAEILWPRKRKRGRGGGRGKNGELEGVLAVRDQGFSVLHQADVERVKLQRFIVGRQENLSPVKCIAQCLEAVDNLVVGVEEFHLKRTGLRHSKIFI